jgi:hypothetical protein
MLHHPLLQWEPLGVAFLVATSGNLHLEQVWIKRYAVLIVMFPTSSVCTTGVVSNISLRISLSHLTFLISYNNLYVTKIRYIFCMRSVKWYLCKGNDDHYITYHVGYCSRCLITQWRGHLAVIVKTFTVRQWVIVDTAKDMAAPTAATRLPWLRPRLRPPVGHHQCHLMMKLLAQTISRLNITYYSHCTAEIHI